MVLALPEDTLFSEAAVADVPSYHMVRPRLRRREMDELKRLLEKAKAPSCILGGGGWDREACAELQKWVEASGLPAGTSFRCQDLFDNRSPSYAGDVGIGINPKLAQRVKEADVLLVIGARLGEMTTSAYTLVEAPVPQADADPRPRRRGGARPRLPAGARHQLRLSAVRRRLAGLFRFEPGLEGADRSGAQGIPRVDRAAADARQASSTARSSAGSRDKLPEDTIIAGGAGNFAGWLHRHFRYKGFRTQLGSTNGSMGYGYPAAVAAKLAEPKRTVFALCGDGDFLMTGQEIATAVQYGANFVAVVVNNGLYGTIRMHQEREYPGRVYGTELRNPDFAAYARAFGGARRDRGAHRRLRAGLSSAPRPRASRPSSS